MAPTLLPQGWQGSANDVQGTENVDVELFADEGIADFLNITELAVSRIIDDDVKSAEFSDGAGDGIFYGNFIGQIGFQRKEVVVFPAKCAFKIGKSPGRCGDTMSFGEKLFGQFQSESF